MKRLWHGCVSWILVTCTIPLRVLWLWNHSLQCPPNCNDTPPFLGFWYPAPTRKGRWSQLDYHVNAWFNLARVISTDDPWQIFGNRVISYAESSLTVNVPLPTLKVQLVSLTRNLKTSGIYALCKKRFLVSRLAFHSPGWLRVFSSGIMMDLKASGKWCNPVKRLISNCNEGTFQ